MPLYCPHLNIGGDHMFQDNPLLAQLKQQMQSELPKKEGVVKATERGFGFLETDEKESLSYTRK